MRLAGFVLQSSGQRGNLLGCNAEPPTGMWEWMEVEKHPRTGVAFSHCRDIKPEAQCGSRWRGRSHPIRPKQSQLQAELLWSTDTSHQPLFDFQCGCNMTFRGKIIHKPDQKCESRHTVAPKNGFCEMFFLKSVLMLPFFEMNDTFNFNKFWSVTFMSK